jgi:hypothetical protein
MGKAAKKLGMDASKMQEEKEEAKKKKEEEEKKRAEANYYKRPLKSRLPLRLE